MSGITTIIGNLLAAGCIGNEGIANALTRKLSAAQMDISAGQIKTAINVLMAFIDQVQAQSGKHIAASCTTVFPLIVTGTAPGELNATSVNVTFAPATVLTTEVAGLIMSLKASVTTADPITGFVVDSTGTGVMGAKISLLDSLLNTVATSTATDVTGFYYFARHERLLVSGRLYTAEEAVFPSLYCLHSSVSRHCVGRQRVGVQLYAAMRGRIAVVRC